MLLHLESEQGKGPLGGMLLVCCCAVCAVVVDAHTPCGCFVWSWAWAWAWACTAYPHLPGRAHCCLLSMHARHSPEACPPGTAQRHAPSRCMSCWQQALLPPSPAAGAAAHGCHQWQGPRPRLPVGPAAHQLPPQRWPSRLGGVLGTGLLTSWGLPHQRGSASVA